MKKKRAIICARRWAFLEYFRGFEDPNPTEKNNPYCCYSFGIFAAITTTVADKMG